jgi:hypothetical protein
MRVALVVVIALAALPIAMALCASWMLWVFRLAGLAS